MNCANLKVNEERKPNPIQEKSFEFAVAVVRFTRTLKEAKEYELASQFVRCGTSVGAKVEEGIAAQSKKDFVHKLSIANKEAREAAYWIRLLLASETGDSISLKHLLEQAEEIIRILNSILATCRERYSDIVCETDNAYITNSEFLISN